MFYYFFRKSVRTAHTTKNAQKAENVGLCEIE